MSAQTLPATLTSPPTNPPGHSGRGAPTSYRPEYCATIIEYFRVRSDAIAQYLPLTKESKNLPIEWHHLQMPTFSGFADSIDTTQVTLLEWSKRHPDFALAYARAKEIHRKVYEDGLTMGRLNPTGAIFAAKNVLGWRDKIEVEQTGNNDNGNTIMAICLKAADVEDLSQFRALLDRMKAKAVAAGLLNADGTPAPTALIL